jgi:hypothetical protein
MSIQERGKRLHVRADHTDSSPPRAPIGRDEIAGSPSHPLEVEVRPSPVANNLAEYVVDGGLARFVVFHLLKLPRINDRASLV